MSATNSHTTDELEAWRAHGKTHGFECGQIAGTWAVVQKDSAPCVVVPRDVAEYCQESAMMLRDRLAIAPNSPEYQRAREVQEILKRALYERSQP